MHPQSTIDRFWALVRKADGCWLWQGATSRGYGKFTVGWKQPRVRAHRFAWEITYGAIPPGQLVLHRCKQTPACVRPDHLYLGDQIANMADRSRDGTGFRAIGEDHHHAKLTAEQIPLIWQWWSAGERKEDIAAWCGVSMATISFVVTGRAWAHVPRPEGLPQRASRHHRAPGESNPGSKLTAPEIKAIRTAAAAGASHLALATHYGVSQPTISNIVARRTWRHVN